MGSQVGDFPVSERVQRLFDHPRLFIDGRWNMGSGPEFEKLNPTTGRRLSTISIASESQVDQAIGAARAAHDAGVWCTASPADRSKKLYELVELIEKNRSFLCEVLVADLGQPAALADSRQIGGSLRHLEWFAEAARRGPDGWYERSIGLDVPDAGPMSSSMLVREPIGVVAAFIAYNYPYTLTIWKLGAALAAGCSIVLLPSLRTALSALALWTVIEQLDLPPGVVNFVLGEEAAGKQLSTSPDVDMVSFTGSVGVGAAVMAQAASTIKKVVLELGGKSASILLPKADMATAVGPAISRLMSNTGQACGAPSRVLVHERDFDLFAERAIEQLETLTVGDPRDARTQIGPLIDARHLGAVQGHVERAKADGWKVLAGGGKPPEDLDGGFFMNPVLLTGLGNDSELCQNEQFGPVGAVLPYRNIDEAVQIANDSSFGLNASIFGPTREAVDVGRRIRSGTVVVNGGGRTCTAAPWGGFRQSGVGREAGDEGFREFFEVKHLQVGIP